MLEKNFSVDKFTHQKFDWPSFLQFFFFFFYTRADANSFASLPIQRSGEDLNFKSQTGKSTIVLDSRFGFSFQVFEWSTKMNQMFVG